MSAAIVVLFFQDLVDGAMQPLTHFSRWRRSEISSVPQYVQPDQAVLGDVGVAVTWRLAEIARDRDPVCQRHDMIWKGNHPLAAWVTTAY